MVRFYGLCDGKIMLRNCFFFWFLSGNINFFSQNFWRVLSNWEQLIVNYM